TVKTRRKLSATTGGLPTNTLRDNDQFGTSVTGAGDLDADGIPDLAVGEPGDDDGGTDRGALLLLTLDRNGSVRAQRKISALGGTQSVLRDNDRFGTTVASLGDLDGDGIGDLAIGSPGDDDGGTDRGAVHVIRMNNLASGGAMASDARFWVDAADAASVQRTDGVVTAWRDRTGRGNDLVAVGAASAASRTTTVDGFPGLRTTGAAVLATTTSFKPTQATVLAVASMGTTSSQQRVVSGLNNDWTIGWMQGTEDRGWFGAPLATQARPASTDTILYSATVSASTATLWRNSAALATQAGSFVAPDGLQIGGGRGSGERSIAVVREVIVYDRVLSESERRPIEAYLQRKWAVSTTGSGGPGGTGPTGRTNPTAWYDASAETSLVRSENGSVVAWRDRSDADQPMVATNPSTGAIPASSQTTFLDRTALNGRPAVVTMGGTPLGTMTNFAGPTTVLVVGRLTGQRNGRLVSGIRNNWLLGWHAGCQDRAHFDGWVGGHPCPAATRDGLLYSATTGNGQATYWRDGTLIGTQAGGYTSPNGLQIGGDAFLWGSERSAGAVSEVLVYNRTLSIPERQATEAYLARKWGLTVATDVNPAMAGGPVLWVDASDTASITTGSGGAITRWADRSGAGNHLSPVIPPASWSATGLNDRPAIRTGGATTLSTRTQFNPTGVTVFAVGAAVGTDYASTNRSRFLSGARNNWLLGWHDACQDRAHFDGWVNGAPCNPLSNQAQLYSATTGNGQASYWRNGTLLGSVAGNYSVPNGLTIGGYPWNWERFDGAISEVIVYDRVLTDAERQATEAYLAAKWGLSGLPKATTKVSDTSAGGLGGVLRDGDRLGQGVTGIADLDGDGIRDAIVGAPGDDDGGTDRGAVHVLFLRADGTVRARQKISATIGGLTGLADNDRFGTAVTAIGTLQGTPAIAVGAPGDDTASTDVGAVYVLRLNTDGTVLTQQKIVGTPTATPPITSGPGPQPVRYDLWFAGTCPSWANCGVYSPWADHASIPDGIPPTTTGVGFPNLHWGCCPYDRYGFRMRTFVTVPTTGAYTFYLRSDDQGTIRISPNDNPSRAQVIAVENGCCGYLGDPSKAGTVTLTAGVRYYLEAYMSEGPGGDYLQVGVTGPGITSVIDVPTTWLTDPGTTGAGGWYPRAMRDTGEQFGQGVAAMGDVDGDGVRDLVVGAPGDDDSGTDAGAAYVVLLNPDGTAKTRRKITAATGLPTNSIDANDRFGTAVTAIGDLDNDGTTDLAIGTPGDDDGGTDRGAVHLVMLNPDSTVKTRRKLSATTGGLPTNTLRDNDQFGTSVTGAGDLDADGIPDLAVG
ncbi:MAG: hypothetical protein ACKO91_06735, partial [Acidimicrobiales bacterium]